LEESVVVNNLADLVTVKTLASGDATPEEGDTVVFEIVVTNNGAAQATNVSLTDFLPAGLTAIGANGFVSQGTYDDATGLFDIGTLNVGESATLMLAGTVDAGQGGNTITNVTTAAMGDQVDPSTVGDDLDESVIVDVPQVVNPGIGVAKQVVGTPLQLANGNFEVVYELIVENTGDVDLANLSLVEDFVTAFGSAVISGGDIVLSTPPSLPGSTLVTNFDFATDVEVINQDEPSFLAVGDSFAVQFTIEVDPDADGAPTVLNNQVTVSGEAVDADGPILDEAGDPIVVTDLSDSGADPNGNNIGADGDTGGSDDPTPLLIPAADLVTVKTLASGDSTPDVGDVVTFLIEVTNNGGDPATGVVLTDFLPAGLTPTANNGTVSQGAYDSASGIFEIGDLPVGETATLTLEGIVNADQAGNTITNTTTAAMGNQLDPSMVGDDLEESVVVDEVLVPSLGLAKEVVEVLDFEDHFDVTFRLVFENTGDVDLTNLAIFDDIASQFGPAFLDINDVAVENFDGTGTAPTVNGAFATDTTESIITGGTANVGDSFEVVFTVGIDADAAGNSGLLVNQGMAQGVGIDPDTGLVDATLTAFDVSDNGVDPAGENGEDNLDGTFGNDPTPIQIADLGIAKAVIGEPTVDVFGVATVDFQVVVENIGTVDLGQLSLIEDLQGQFGSALLDAGTVTLLSQPSDAGSSIAANAAFNGGSVVELLDPTNDNTLVVGDSFVLIFTVEVNALEVDGLLENQVTGESVALDSSGNAIVLADGSTLQAIDVSDNGVDPGSENGEDDGDGIFANDPTPVGIAIDPTGFFFNADTGEILTGGSISVTGPSAGSVNLIDDGADGSFQFFGTEEGQFIVTVTAPEGFELDTDFLESGAFDPTGQGSPVLLGSDDADGDGFLDDIDPTQFFLSFDLEAGDPAIFFNNLPFIASQPEPGPGDGPDPADDFLEIPESADPDGTSGNPPVLIGLPRFAGQNVGSILGGPGPIFTGNPINTNENPFTLQSNRPITGGFSIDQASVPVEEGCCEEIVADPCCDGVLPEAIEAPVFVDAPAFVDGPVVVEAPIDDCGCDGEAGAVIIDEAIPVEEGCEEIIREDCGHTGVPPMVLKPSFLNRFRNWLQ